MTTPIALREKGQYPISIGTSLALEGAVGIHPDRPGTNQLPKYKELWFNLHTLFRNLMASMTAEQQRALTVPDLVPALLEDVLGCQAVLEQVGKNRLEPNFYLPTYQGLVRRFPLAKFKVPNTDNQLIYEALHHATLRRFMDERPPLPIQHDDVQISGKHGTALLVTHFPVDLLARYQFDRLDLLESHTGKIKPPSQWNTKLTGKSEDVAILPFMPFTLQVFGDGQHFTPQPKALKDAVVATAKATHWSSVTTREKVVATLDQHVKDAEVLTLLHQFY